MAEKKIAAPFIPDSSISSKQALGRELQDKQSKPRFAGTEPFTGGQNMLLSALLGLQAGTKAGIQTAPLQSPIVSLLAGLGAGASVPGQVDEMRMQKIENMAVDEVSPALVERFPELAGVPLSLINKIAPLLKRHDGFEQQLALIQARGDQSRQTKLAGAGIGNNREESRLRGELRTLTRDFRTVRDSYGKILSVANDPSAAGDLSLIFAYMKLLDPTSVVRESEQATAENARGVPDTVRNLYNKVMVGERLPPAQRQDFIKQARNLYSSQATTVADTRRQYRDLAERLGVNPDNIDIDFGAGFDDSGSKKAAVVMMIAPNGKEFPVPLNNVDAAIKRGAKRK